jgi:RNA polymerase sigma-70 factor (ECF subfamily)
MASGDSEGLRDLNARYGRKLAAIARRFLGDEADAEEVAADVLWQAWREAGSFDPARGSVAAWLVTIARSRALDRLRARRARQPLPGQAIEAEPVPDPTAAVSDAERSRIVRRALGNLEPNERSVMELAYFSELSQSEIAQKLSMPLGTVKTRVRAAMMKLREALAERA